ncbi:small integral membrane protein 17 isoform X4 [Bubalus bubalis]|nr:small integral membrane protein 17 isoform X4 [Bubalus bubalis]
MREIYLLPRLWFPRSGARWRKTMSPRTPSHTGPRLFRQARHARLRTLALALERTSACSVLPHRRPRGSLGPSATPLSQPFPHHPGLGCGACFDQWNQKQAWCYAHVSLL